MKSLNKIIRIIIALIRALYRFVDRGIVVPVTKFIILVTDKFSGSTGKFEKWLTKKNTLVFISLIFSITLFFYVDSLSNVLIDSSAQVLYDQKVEVTYNAEAYVVEGLPDTADVTLIGRKIDIYLAKQLSSGTVSADISNLKEGTHKINLNYESPIRAVDYKLDPSTVNINVYPKVSSSRTINIDIINQNQLDEKLSISNVTLDQTEVIIKGADHTLKAVSSVKALVDVKQLIDPTVGVMLLNDVKLVAYDSDGNVVNVEMVPEKVTASINIESPSKEIPVKVIPKGDVEFGKAIDSINSSVTKVTVYGDKEALEKMEYVPIELDVTGLSETKSYTVVISKPNGVSHISEKTASVTVTLAKEITKEINDVYIETINLDPSYKAVAIGEGSTKTTVILKGTQAVLNKIEATSIKALVDLSGYSEGDYEVEVKVSGEEVKASYTPKTTKIKIRISAK